MYGIYQAGDRAAEMHLLVSGTVTVRHAKKLRRAPAAARGRPAGLAAAGRGGSCGPAAAAPAAHAVAVEAGGAFGELALFPDLAPPFRADTAVAASWVVVYTLSALDVPRIEARHPLLVGRLRELCRLRLAQGRADGRAGRAPEALVERARGGAKHCRLNTLVSRLQRDLVVIKERRALAPASGGAGDAVLKLLTAATGGGGGGGGGGGDGGGGGGEPAKMVGISCVVSSGGELLGVEHSTAGVAGDGLRSLGFFAPGRSARRMLAADEVRPHRRGGGGGRLTGVLLGVWPRFDQGVAGV